MKTLVIKDLTVVTTGDQTRSARLLSIQEMHRVRGGRAISVLVDGRPGGVVDDFALNMDIFNGNIGVKVV